MTKEQLAKAGVTPIFCPCCQERIDGTYSRGHKFDCRLVAFNAKVRLWEKAR